MFSLLSRIIRGTLVEFCSDKFMGCSLNNQEQSMACIWEQRPQVKGFSFHVRLENKAEHKLRRKETKVRAENNKTKTTPGGKKINETSMWFFKVLKNGLSSSYSTWKKQEDTNYWCQSWGGWYQCCFYRYTEYNATELVKHRIGTTPWKTQATSFNKKETDN